MSWTAPRTWIAGETLTAALLNTHLRDNMLETEAAKATGGSYFVGAALNSIVERKPKQAIATGTFNTSSTSFTGTSPAVTVATSDRAFVVWSAQTSSNAADLNTWMSVAVSGATTIAASTDYSMVGRDATANRVRQYMREKFFFALTPGNNTFTAQYRVSGASTGTWTDRRLLVLPF